ncbi:MAG: hypothetical protein JNM41_13770 [Flavipsychrobacter sp.]|nr:hypothetical protein [Flavipsychrobacter sp.]
MFEIILLTYLSFRNSVRARIKGLNAWFWGGVTAVTFISALCVGCMVVVFNFLADTVNINDLSSTDLEVRSRVTKQLVEALNSNPLHVLTIELFGVGGYLLIRYVLEKKPNKKETEIHWMDRLGENR